MTVGGEFNENFLFSYEFASFEDKKNDSHLMPTVKQAKITRTKFLSSTVLRLGRPQEML